VGDKEKGEIRSVALQTDPPENGDTGLALTAKSSGKSLVSSSGAAVDADLPIVIGAWPLLTAHSRSIIIGIARKSANCIQSK
jgi:hypothetical protein